MIALAGVEMFFSGQLDVGKIHVQVGIEGLQATILPVLLLLLGILVILMPAHRIFYGTIALALAVYSLIGVNLGGFFIGMLLSSVGGVLVVAWMPKPAAAPSDEIAVDDTLADDTLADDTWTDDTAADDTAAGVADDAGERVETMVFPTNPFNEFPAEPLPLVRRRS